MSNNQQKPDQNRTNPNAAGNNKTQQRPGQPNQNKNTGTGNNPATGRDDQSKF